MKILALQNYTRGWLVGDFAPNVFRTKECEFAVKTYTDGESEPAHFHKRATEISVIVTGEFNINGKKLKAGDVLIMEPGDVARFKCVKAGSTAVIKIPSVRGDKYLV